MKMSGLLLGVIMSTVGFTGCSLKDADIKTSIETALKAVNDMTGVTVNVENGIATMEGQCKDEVCKLNLEKIAQEVEGVKTVISNLTVAPPPAPIAQAIVIPDDPLIKPVADAARDFPGVKAEVRDSIITLTGNIRKKDMPRLMKALSSLKPKRIEQKLRVNRKNSRVSVSAAR